MRLLADCGNSTIKLALAQDGGIWQFERVDPKPELLDEFIKPFNRFITIFLYLLSSSIHRT